jgi:hypothetical protein
LIEGCWKGMEPRDEYVKICDQLPLFGGRPMADLAEMVRARGFEPVTVLPLMDAELWTETPHDPRYLIIAKKPAG